jgi:hypothetical protein
MINTAEQQSEKIRLWRDKLLRGVAENICRPCTKPIKKTTTLNYDNPLSCGCHCEGVVNILATVIKLDVEIRRLQDSQAGSKNKATTLVTTSG